MVRVGLGVRVGVGGRVGARVWGTTKGRHLVSSVRSKPREVTLYAWLGLG